VRIECTLVANASGRLGCVGSRRVHLAIPLRSFWGGQPRSFARGRGLARCSTNLLCSALSALLSALLCSALLLLCSCSALLCSALLARSSEETHEGKRGNLDFLPWWSISRTSPGGTFTPDLVRVAFKPPSLCAA